MKKIHVMTGLCIGLSVAVIGGAVFYTNRLHSRANETVQEPSKMQVSVQKDVDEADASGLVLADWLSAVKESGKIVAESLDGYGKQIVAMTDADEAKLEEIRVKRQEILETLKSCFVEDADVQGTWYTGNSYNMTAKWQMESVYDASPTKANVFWTCRDEDNRVLVIANSVYDAKTGLFAKPVVKTTSFGAYKSDVTLQNGLTEEDVYGDKQEEIEQSKENIFDAAKNNNVGPSNTMDEEQAKALEEALGARYELQEQYEKENGGNE